MYWGRVTEAPNLLSDNWKHMEPQDIRTNSPRRPLKMFEISTTSTLLRIDAAGRLGHPQCATS